MKLWQKNSTSIDKRIEQFTIGQDAVLDLVLAPFDILGNLAHSTMLESVGLLTDKELAQLRPALQQLYEHVKQDGFTIEDGVEDVHSQVELTLTRELGDVGKKVHSGRSRNDQVLVDLRLYFRDELKQLVLELLNLFDRLQELSEQHQDVLLPGYTHTQVAMPSSFGLWFGAYAESLTDDMQVLLSAYRVVNQNPLGSAAGYGSSFPLNRTLTTELLGFDDLNYNAVYAQMGLVAKNAILLVDFTNHQRELGLSVKDALIESGRERLRPILMTTLAMVFGMLPIALASGAGAEIKNGLAWVIIGGLTSSLLLTLVLVPSVYVTIDNAMNKLKKRFGKKEVAAKPKPAQA